MTMTFKQSEPILDAKKMATLAARKSKFFDLTDRLSENLYGGRITLGMWEEEMRTQLRMYLYGSAAIGKGGMQNMTASDRGKIGAHLKKQYKWLHGFAKAIADNRDDVSLAAIKARAHLYGEAGSIVATEAQAGYFAPNTRRKPIKILPWMPGDGSTPCLNRCGCRWVLSVLSIDKEEGTKTVQAVWTLDPVKDHCEGCAPREGVTEVVTVPINVNVPAFIGLGGSVDRR